MSTIIKDVVVPKSHHLEIEVDVPSDFPVGEATLILTLESKTTPVKPVNRAVEMFGKGKGKVRMPEDFDAPLEDFAEYM